MKKHSEIQYHSFHERCQLEVIPCYHAGVAAEVS